ASLQHEVSSFAAYGPRCGRATEPSPWRIRRRSLAHVQVIVRTRIAAVACASTSAFRTCGSTWPLIARGSFRARPHHHLALARLLPREAAPRPRFAAVRSGNVMYIEAAAGNGQWLIRDYNSGGGLSRMHVRDVRGYVFVNPHGKSIGQLNCEEEILLPDVAGGFNDERQLRSLVVFGQRVPGHRAGEAALGADRQTVEFDVARGFLRTSL